MTSELRQRIITALLLLPVVVWCVFLAPDATAFASFAGAIVIVGAWEWTRLMGWMSVAPRVLYVVLLALLLVSMRLPELAGFAPALYMLSAGFWLLALRLVTGYPDNASLWARAWLLAPVGLVLLLPAWLGLTSLHAVSPWWLMFLFLLVWGADTGAYFAGRALGKNKLAPAVSPGKTIEGMVGGLALALAIALAVAIWRDLSGIRLMAFMGLCLLTSLASVLGDLFESMTKRHAGIKDSGNIFPGHGGALDRIDSLTAAAPVFALGWWLAGGF
ncbi:MAG: phosphatidate cytidylyltransferase [Moraxellaceae bacterium]|jgi:phosphatidate cytidylyltransferase|nr:phosphatidate cytidylyltransferase [Moraxellaceae bacterium]